MTEKAFTYSDDSLNLSAGDIVRVEGFQGTYKFLQAVVNGEHLWLDVYGPLWGRGAAKARVRAVFPEKVRKAVLTKAERRTYGLDAKPED